MHTRSTMRASALTGVAGLIGAALVIAPTTAHAVPAVSPADSGSIEVWGSADALGESSARTTYPAAEGPWSASALGSTDTRFGVRQDGKLVRLSGTDPLLNIPTNLATATVKAVSTNSSTAAVVTADGALQLWGGGRGGLPAQTRTAAELGGEAVDVAVGTQLTAVLLANGKVRMLASGVFEFAELEDGTEITNAKQIAASFNYGFARLDGGGVVGFSTSGALTNFPAAVAGDDLEDPVVSFEVGPGAVAVTESGAVHTWNYITGEPLTSNGAFPTSSVTGKVVDVAANAQYFAARTESDEVAVWGQSDTHPFHDLMATVPDEVVGEDIGDLVGGPGNTFASIVTPPATPVTLATPAALTATTPRVGDTLTGTPATFNGSPSPVVTNRWLANDEPIAGATGTTLTLTPALLNKTIMFQTTATRGEEEPVVSTSGAVGPVQEPVKIASTTALTSPSRVYGQSGTATVSVTNAGSRPVTGTVTLTGAGPNQTKTLVNGKAAFALPKSLSPKAYTLTASYSGSSLLNVSSKTSRFSVARAKSKAPTFKKTKTPTSKKSGKATVTVSTVSGLAKATGKVTVTLKKGSSSKKVSGYLSGGKRSIKLPKLKKGTWKVTVSYAGDKNYVGQKSKTYSLKIKK